MRRDGMDFRRNDRYGGRWVDAEGGVVFYNRRTKVDVPIKGRSLTNMVYAEDGRVFLQEDGRVFTAGRITAKPKPVIEWPEHEKLTAEVKLSEITQTIGLALDGPGAPYVLCTLERDECSRCQGLGSYLDGRGDEVPCSRCVDEDTGESTGYDPERTHYRPVTRLEEALGVLVGVDQSVLQDEKQQMYEQLHARARTVA